MSEQDIKQSEDINIQMNEDEFKETQKEIILKLGDIILIIDPTNEILHNNVFFIEYIDNHKIKLINSKTFDKVVLQISPDKTIGDGNIQTITILSSNPKSGYARQNDLLPGIWINIHFGGDLPIIITGKITNLEEDMIEIQTTDNDTIYINFGYQGIPEDLPIETFEIRSQPPEIKTKVDTFIPNEKDEAEAPEIGEEIPKVIKKIPKSMNLGDIEFGDIIQVEEYVNIDKEKFRYNINAQTNDMLEDMLSNIPSHKRSNNVLNNIHIMINRFLQLREISSKFDTNKNITGVIKHTAEDRPLADYLSEFKNTLYWIMLVAKNVKKIYQDKDTDNIEDTDYDDIVRINMDDDLNEFASLFKKDDSSRYLKTKYLNYTYNSFDSLMTPFNSVMPDEANDVFTVSNGIIVEGNVESDINVIIDNLGDLYSSVATKSESSSSRAYLSEIASRRFVIQKYNLAAQKLHANSFKSQHLITNRVKVTENDPISINSIITLPEPAIRFSQINLPGSNLLVKSNLNLHFLNYWQLLKQKTKLTTVPIVGLDTELEYDEKNFVDNIKQYYLNLTEHKKPDELTKADIYKIFLKIIIPKTRVLFTLVKKYIKGRLSLVEVVNYLEPFKIYSSDLTFRQYREINSFIYNKIKTYNSTFKEYNMAFSDLKNSGILFKKTSDEYYFKNPLFDLLNTYNKLESHTNIMEIYGFNNKKMKISGSEFLKIVTVSDFGNYYNTAIALINIELMFPTKMKELFNNDKEKLKQIIDKDKKIDTCNTFVIAKKYISKDALISDNQKTIYFDKQYDTTNYDLLDSKYKKEKNTLSSEELILFLTNKFQEKDGMNEIDAEHMAMTLVNQAKRVRDGDYAILITSVGEFQEIMADQMEYYVRKNEEWILDKNVDPNTFIKDDDVLCNINYKCIYNPKENVEDNCESMAVTKISIVQNALKQIMDQFDSRYEISRSELNSFISQRIDYFKNIFTKLQTIKKNNFYKYNNIQYELGLSVSNEILEIVVSPYAKLRDLIMGQNDFIKKQNDIIQFVSMYCYEGNPSVPNKNDREMENEWWLYCKDTNTKLLPKFHHILASTFIRNNSKYDEVLNYLKRTIGKQSDNGDAWVDENSGEIICYIDLDVTEGYIDGFLDKSRAIIEKDAGEIVLEAKPNDKDIKRLSSEGQIISNIVSTISDNMGIDMELNREFIIRIVTELMQDTSILARKSDYEKMEKDKNKEGKKTKSYAEYSGSVILYLTLAVYLIAIQTSIPSIKTRKTAPGCVRSFTGFPFEGEGDDSSVTYLACVALKSRDKTTYPWNVLQTNEEKLVATIKKTIVQFLSNYPEIQQRIDKKIEYLLMNPEEFIPEEHKLTKWIHFLPPLKIFHVNRLENVTSGFVNQLNTDLKSGSIKQNEKIKVIQSKIIAFSLAIQEEIQKLVEKKTLLLRSGSQIYMDNACCNEDTDTKISALQYFINDNKNIETYNKIITELSLLLHDINIITNAVILLSKENSKRIFPVVSNTFSEETIYYAFISLCKFHSDTPLSPDVLSICNDKPDYLKKMDTIQEKISKLKNDGRNYTNEQFLRLFQIASRHNILDISFETNYYTVIQNLQHLLNRLHDTNDETVPTLLVEHLNGLLETHDVLLKEKEDKKNIKMRNMKNYLQTAIQNMRPELIEFLKNRAKLRPIKLTNLSNFINNLGVWNSNETIRNADIKISDDQLNNYVNFMKNFIESFVIIFPSIIINKQTFNIQNNNSWKISQVHMQGLSEKISNFYEPLEKFYDNKHIIKVLKEIKTISKGIHLLSKNTPILTNIQIGDTTFYSSFDKKIIMLLYEYYVLSVLTDYCRLTKNTSAVSRGLAENSNIASSLDVDFLQDQTQFDEVELEIISGNELTISENISKLLVSYLEIMMKSKEMINMSYDDIADKIFKLKEAEKYNFTDQLRDMGDEKRKVDNILKYNKLDFYGMFDDIRGYNDEHFEYDKKIAENVARIQNKFGHVDDFLMNDDDEERTETEFIDKDNFQFKKSENDDEPMDDDYEYEDMDDAYEGEND
jgi:hypothetical protein